MTKSGTYAPSIDLASFSAFCAKPRGMVAGTALQVLQSTLKEIDELQMIPAHVAAIGVRRFYWSLGYFNARSNEKSAGDEEALRLDRCKFADQWLKDFLAREGGKEEFARMIDSTFEEVEARDEFRRAISTIHFVSVPALWMAFECFARDLWVATINAASTSLAHRAFSHAEGEDLLRKYVPVSELARNGFNLQGKVGSILAAKYLFTDVEGVGKAWNVVDPTCFLVQLPSAKDLITLEKTRHLIVHKGGFVDEKYLRETGAALQIGDRIEISAMDVANWCKAICEVAIGLVQVAEKNS